MCRTCHDKRARPTRRSATHTAHLTVCFSQAQEKQVIFLTLDNPVTIGRNRHDWYTPLELTIPVETDKHRQARMWLMTESFQASIASFMGKHVYACLVFPVRSWFRVLSSTGGVLVSCQVEDYMRVQATALSLSTLPQDFSTNGILLNGYRLRKSAAIVMDGDTLQLPNSKGECIRLRQRVEVERI